MSARCPQTVTDGKLRSFGDLVPERSQRHSELDSESSCGVSLPWTPDQVRDDALVGARRVRCTTREVHRMKRRRNQNGRLPVFRESSYRKASVYRESVRLWRADKRKVGRANVTPPRFSALRACSYFRRRKAPAIPTMPMPSTISDAGSGTICFTTSLLQIGPWTAPDASVNTMSAWKVM